VNGVVRVAIEAQIQSGSEGGIEQFLISLLYGLASLDDNEIEYKVVGAAEGSEWLARYVGEHQQLVRLPRVPPSNGELIRRTLGPLRRPGGVVARRAREFVGGPPSALAPVVPQSNGFFERMAPHVLHITYPLHFVKAAIPTVFNIHDLQHRHYPEFFSTSHMNWRETVYPAAISHSAAIVTLCEWGRADIIRQYDADPDKVHVIPTSAPMDAYPPLSANVVAKVKKKLRLPGSFALYPAMTYGHKNHIRLLQAIALLRDRDGFVLNIVCTGKLKHAWPQIRECVRELRLQDQVSFTGYLDVSELKAVYHLAQFMIFPSLFEGAGIPVLEAFTEQLPVTCSDIPALREYGAQAALYFEPTSIESMADAARRMATDGELRSRLREFGRGRSALFTPERTASMYRALYHDVAKRPPSQQTRIISTPQDND
jgi:glycosyltransferase involved in cell wall biosynthesis